MPQLDQPPPSRFQFRLSFLIYILTIAALALAVLRRVFEIGGGWQFNVVMSIYVAALIAYFAFRFPTLIRRLRRSREISEAKRRELREYADRSRSAAKQDQES